jgi:hypothetical protein
LWRRAGCHLRAHHLRRWAGHLRCRSGGLRRRSGRTGRPCGACGRSGATSAPLRRIGQRTCGHQCGDAKNDCCHANAGPKHRRNSQGRPQRSTRGRCFCFAWLPKVECVCVGFASETFTRRSSRGDSGDLVNAGHVRKFQRFGCRAARVVLTCRFSWSAPGWSGLRSHVRLR